MLKAGYLCLFEMTGYNAVMNAFGQAIQSTLSRYYFESATSANAESYFREFKNSTKILGVGADLTRIWDDYKPWDFDSLDDREFFVHRTPLDTIFAATCLFKINGMTITVTLPFGSSKGDPGTVWKWYQNLVAENTQVTQAIHRMRFKGDHWEIEGRPVEFHVLDAP